MRIRCFVGWESGPKALSSVALHYAYVRRLIYSLAFTEQSCIDSTSGHHSRCGTSPAHSLPNLAQHKRQMQIVALWTWTDMEIMKMQVSHLINLFRVNYLTQNFKPYVDLVHGDSPPHRSLLLDYTRDK